jgi:hypothetical protein
MVHNPTAHNHHPPTAHNHHPTANRNMVVPSLVVPNHHLVSLVHSSVNKGLVNNLDSSKVLNLANHSAVSNKVQHLVNI